MEISLQKKVECDAIQNLLPYINKRLNLNITNIKEAYLCEKPDFIFSNGIDTTIGIEVVECHPSVQRNRKYNRARVKGFQTKVCKSLLNSHILKSCTKNQKINIIINRYTLTSCVNKCGKTRKGQIEPEAFVKQVETILKKWYTEGYMCETDNIKQLKIIKTVGKNIVQFNNISRRDPIKWVNVKYSIKEKNKKVEFYKKENKCDEYWLCVYIPFEECRQSNEIDYNEKMDAIAAFIGASPFEHIFLTSVMPNDVKQMK